MDQHLDLPHITLDMLILDAAYIGPLHFAGIVQTTSEEV